MQEVKAPAEASVRGSTVGGWALIVGAGCFALFWTLQPTSLDESVPWLPSLGLHATTVASLTIGLGLLARDLRQPPQAPMMAILGAALTVVGLVSVFPLIPVELGVVAVAVISARYPGPAPWSLLVGSAGMLVLYVARYQQQAGEVFGEGSPPFQLGPKLAFEGVRDPDSRGWPRSASNFADETSSWARRIRRCVDSAASREVIDDEVLRFGGHIESPSI